MRRLWRASVWNDAQIDPEDHKHRWKLRLWMPLYLATVVLAGIGVANHGSPVLDRTFPDAIVNALGFSLVWFALVAYIGITFPALWRVEIAGLIATSMMIGTYGAALLFVAESPSSREFLSWLVLGGVVFVFSRLTTLGEEIKERRTGAA
ncbi:hypothetical protein ACLBWJ_13010 [Microbacterium sp. M4A5_1d]|jgi:hypothetical protein